MKDTWLVSANTWGDIMGRKTVELRAVVRLKDGSEIIQTGIYVFEDATIASIRDLMKNGIKIEGIRVPVAYVEFDMKDEEEEE